MSEALDLSVNASVGLGPTTVVTVTPPPSQASSLDQLDSTSPTSLLSFTYGMECLQNRLPSTLHPVPHGQPLPLVNSLSTAILQSPHPQSNPPLGTGPLPTFLPLILPQLSTNGQMAKRVGTGSGAMDLSIQSILHTSPCSIANDLHTLSANSLQMTAFIPGNTVTSFPPYDCLSLDFYSSNPVLMEHKDFLKKFASFHECGNAQCRSMGLKEHFHCTECLKVINRREETIRHVKWHKKRVESLQYGFMRYCSSDNCGYTHCSHNMKQTHYHCIRPNCSKTYISTSDVQMHANFHRKDAVILQEGFRRFRAAEDCGNNDCLFFKEHTTHFHCRRHRCKFTFKNKADMEKHKNHHLKNDAIAKDGFRKFIKAENCNFIGCKYSGLVNHIHCIRPGCNYIVHSTGQISSHKRKHERRGPISFQCLLAPINQQMASLPCENSNSFSLNTPNTTLDTTSTRTSASTTPKPSSPQFTSLSLDPQDLSSAAKLIQRASTITEMCWQKFQNPTISTANQDYNDDKLVEQVLEEVLSSLKLFKNCPSCDNGQCSLHATAIDHFHCFRTGCMDTLGMDPLDELSANTEIEKANTISSGDMDSWKEHWLLHAWQSTLALIGFTPCRNDVCDCSESETKAHLHCYFWPICDFTIDFDAATSARLLRHLSRHSRHFSIMMLHTNDHSTNLSLEVSGSTQRKRGRPPKYSRDIHIPKLDISPIRCVDDNPNKALTMEDFQEKTDRIAGGLKFFPPEEPLCVDRCCPFHITKEAHFHCIQPRCHMAVANLVAANSHRREFHAYVKVEPGYEYFDRSIDCRRPVCYAKRDTAHYHCLRPRCGYSFVRMSKMKQHTEFHKGSGSVTGGTIENSVESVEKSDNTSDLHLRQSDSIMPPLGLEKSVGMGNFVPFLMRILAEQVNPINRLDVGQNFLAEMAESISTGSEEKMDWNETVDKEEAIMETSTTMSTNNSIIMEKNPNVLKIKLDTRTVGDEKITQCQR